MPLAQADWISLISAQVGQIVSGPAPSDAYFSSLVQAILPLLPTWYTAAQSAVLPDANGNFTFSKVELVAAITRRWALQALLGPLAAKANQSLDSFLRVQARERFQNVQENIKATEGEIETIRRRIRDSRTPVLAAILRLSPVRADMPTVKPGPGQPVTTLPNTIDPNDDSYRGAPIYDTDDVHQPFTPGPAGDQPGQPEGW